MANRVKLPDGSIAEFPDNFSDTQITEVLQKQFPQGTQFPQSSTPQGANPSAQVQDSSQGTDRIRRATEGQSTDTAGDIPGLTSDPLANIPTEIDGVKLLPDERETILAGQGLKDPKEKRILAARLAGRVGQRDKGGSLSNKVLTSQLGAGVRNFVNLFGIGDLAAGTGQFLSDNGSEDKLSFGEALQMQQEFRRAGEKEFPLTTGLSEVGGALVGGGGLASLAGKGLAKVAGETAAKAFARSAALQEGQKIRNVAKVAALGATEGAITEGITEDNVSGGAALGAVGGPAGLGLARLLKIPVKAFAQGLAKARGVLPQEANQMLKSPAGKSLKILADKLGVSAQDLSLTFRRFEALTGKPPSLAELANKDVGLEIKNLIEASAPATRRAQDLAEGTLSSRADEIGQQIASPARRGAKTAEELKRTSVAREQFAKADNDVIKFSAQDTTDLLNDPNLIDAMPITLARRINEKLDAAGQGNPVKLSGLDVNDLRQALRARGRNATGADLVFNELADELEGIARPQSPAFSRALDEFAARSRRGEGIDTGKKILSQSATENKATVKTLRDNEDKAGFRVGARTALADTAAEGIGQAKSLVDKLVTDSGLIKRLEQVLPAREVTKVRQVARVQKDALERLSGSTPATRSDGGVDILPPLVNAVVVAGPTSAASKVLSTGRIIQSMRKILGIKANDKLMEQLAGDFFDPKKSKSIIQKLRGLGAKDDDILTLFLTASGGAAAVN